MPNIIENLLERLTPQPNHSSPDNPEAAAEESHGWVETAGIAIIAGATAADVDDGIDANGVDGVDETAAADGNEEMAEVDETQADQLSSEVAATFAALASTDNADADLNDTNLAGKEKQSNDNASPTMTGTTLWKGEIGPDNAISIDDESGEREWEISKICKIEEDDDGSKTIIVKWKGWKGFWPEEYEAIKAQVPELVEKFERGSKGEEKEEKTQKKRGPKPKALKPKAEKTNKAKKGAVVAVKQTKKAARVTTAAAKRGRPRKTTTTKTKTKTKTKTTDPKQNRLRLRRLRRLRRQ